MIDGYYGAPFEVKFAEDDCVGSFEGYGAVFGNMDSHGDVIEPGAFAKSLLGDQRAGAGLPPMYKMHGAFTLNATDPIGVWDAVSEDQNGLYVKGRLIGLDTEQGKWTYAQLKEGALTGLSIGYKTVSFKRGTGKVGDPQRFLKELKLQEVSLVDKPSNAQARVYAMKGVAGGLADEIKTIRQFEEFLRDAGYSNAAAKAIAASGFKAKPDPRDEDGIGEAIREQLQALATLIQK